MKMMPKMTSMMIDHIGVERVCCVVVLNAISPSRTTTQNESNINNINDICGVETLIYRIEIKLLLLPIRK